jgi:uncharacterized RDD family membrane protein YckC
MSFVAAPPPAAAAATLATWGRRAGGGLIDLLCVLPFSILALLLGFDSEPPAGEGPIGPAYLFFTVLGWGVLGYNRWVRGGRTGQTWGRRARGIRLVSEQTGRPIGVRLAFVRDLAHSLDALTWYIGFLLPIWDAKRQTLADKVMRTLVVH